MSTYVSAQDVEDLRFRLHRDLDQAFDEFLRGPELSVEAEGKAQYLRSLPAFDYPWPASGVEPFDRAEVFSVSTRNGSVEAVLAWTRREAWGKDRARSVVFRLEGDNTPRRWYPWTEFVETDDGRYAAAIPNPDKPRSTLADGNPLPERYCTRTVARSDELFGSIERGPSLRLVVDAADTLEMVEHGFWVALQRGRLR